MTLRASAGAVSKLGLVISGYLMHLDPACLMFALTLPAATGLKAQFPLIHRRCRVSCLIQPWKIAGLKLNKFRALPIPQAPAPVRY
jgi:hypothetical protein